MKKTNVKPKSKKVEITKPKGRRNVHKIKEVDPETESEVIEDQVRTTSKRKIDYSQPSSAKKNKIETSSSSEIWRKLQNRKKRKQKQHKIC